MTPTHADRFAASVMHLANDGGINISQFDLLLRLHSMVNICNPLIYFDDGSTLNMDEFNKRWNQVQPVESDRND